MPQLVIFVAGFKTLAELSVNKMARRIALSLLILVIAASVLRVRSNSCEEVWFEDAKFDGEPSTCGERIVFLQTPQGGLLTEQEARVKAALENDICADCWPWEKYREDGNTERSAKRGIAIENHMLTAEMLSGLSHIISWGATWDYKLQGGPSLDVWNAAGIEFYPMIWGDGTIAAAEANGMPEGTRALLGFNEPNFPEQANLHPYWAAYHWKDVERIAELNNITTIVSPSMNYHWSFDPIDWLYQFFYHCEGCKVDAIGLHVFSCYANGLKYHLDRYRVFGKPMWVTEIACSDPHSPERLSAEGQMAYMKEAIPLLEADEDVAMYAWFSYFKDEWAHPIVDGENGDAGLIHPNGTLTNLGKLFETFAAGSNLTEINITIPEWKNETNETSSTTTTESETLTTTKSATTSVSETATSSTTGSQTWSSTLTESTTTVTSSVTATGTDTSTQTGSTTTVSSSKTDTTTQTDTSTSATTTRTSSSSSTQSSSATSNTATSSTKTWSGETSSTTVVTVTDTSLTATVTSTVSTTETSVTDTATATSTGSTTLSATNPPEVATTAMSTTATTTATLPAATATATTTLSSTEWATPATTKTLTTTRTLSATTTTWSSSATRTQTTKMVEAPITTVAEATTVTGTATWTGTSTTDNLDSANTTTEHAHTNYTSSRHLTGTAPSTTMTQGGESTTYTLDEEDNTTNDTELTCGEAVEAWCQSDPEAAPFFPLRHCSDWRLHDAMCTSPVGGGQAAPQFSAGTTLQEGSPLSVLFLIMAVIGAAMASAALTSAFHRQRCLWLRYLCCCQKRREDEEQEDLKRAVSEKDWPGRCLNVMGKNASVAPAPEGGVLLPVEALARRVASSPMAGCEGSPVRGTFSKGANNLSEVAVGTPVGTTPASRAAALHTLQEAMAMATAEDSTWDEKQVALDQVGRLLAGGATANLPMALRQEAEAWQCRQDERLRLARSLEAAAEKAAALEDGAREAMGEDGTKSDDNPLRELMVRAKLSVDAGDREAMLAEAARRASTFQEELDAQRLRLQARRRKQSDGDSSLLTAGALLEERDALAGLKDKVAAEFAALPGLREDGAGDEAWDSACDALEEAWKHLSADVQSASQEAQSALTATLGGTKVAKSLEDTDAERRAALAEAARRAAAFDEELQKQKQKLQKRAKGKGSQAAALELGRLLEDKEAYEALESERAAALEECQKFMAEGKMTNSEANDWAQLVEALDAAKADVAELAPETSAEEALPKTSTWAAIAAKVKTGKLEVDSQEQMAMLAEATRRAAAFDEELQKQRSQMKKRRKALQKGATPDQVDPLEACRTLADEQTLKKLAKEQAEACAQCEALAASAEIDTKEAWTELGAAWAAMSKDMAKAEKEARESAKVVTGEGSGLSEALGLVDEAAGGDMAGGSSRRLVEDDGDARRAALQEAARRIATFDEELAKQKAAMRRRRTEASGATALGHALRDGAALRGLSEATAEQRAACEAAIQAAREEGGAGAAAWEDLAQVWGKLQEDVAEATKEVEADAEEASGDIAEISHHLVFRGLAAAARRAAAFERKLQTLRREGTALAGADELRDGLRSAEVQKLRQELAEGTKECEEGMKKVPGDAAETHAAESRAAWQELLNLWQELASDLETLAEAASAPASASATSLRKVFDTSVDDAEKQTALALAARRALQFDEELQRQRQRLVRRKKASKEADAEVPEPVPAECLRALGDAVTLQALASESEVAAAGCREALAQAEAEQKWEEVQGWKQIIQVYENGRVPLEETKQEVEVAGGLSSEADRVAGHRLVHQVAKDQKTSAEACLKAVEKALNTDSGPLEELIEAQQQARSVKSNGGSTRRSRGAEVAAQVQTWDVLEEAQGLLNALKSGEAKGDANSAEAMQVLKRLGDEAAKQLDAISSTQVKEAKVQEKPEQKDAGCQTIFRLGGMAWHANPAVQKLLEELMKVSTQGPTADPDQVDKLDDEVSVIMEKWRKTFIERNRQRGNSLRRQPPEIHAMPPAAAPAAAPTAPQAPPVMLEADLVARAAAKKLEAPPPEAPAWSSVKRDEVKMTVEASSFQSSTFDSSLPGRMPEAEADASRQGSADRSTSPGVRVPTSGRIPHSSEHRRPRAGSEDAQVPSPEKSGQSSEPLASRSRRRRDSESSNFQRDVSGGSVPSCSEIPLQPGVPDQPQALSQAGSEAKNDVLAQLGQIRQSQQKDAPSSRAASKEEPREEPPSGRPSSAVGHRGGPGDSSLLVPPARDASRSVSPSSSVGSSSVSSGHRRPVLDPIARPRGPPLPSAGRLLLATAQQESRETSPHSARSGPAAP